MVLRDQGDLPAARSNFERALANLEIQLGPDHPKTVMVRERLAKVQGETRVAIPRLATSDPRPWSGHCVSRAP